MCNCLEKANERFKNEHNIRVCSTFPFNPTNGEDNDSRAVLKTERTDRKRGKAAIVVATFCPFCGKRYDSDREGE